MPQRSILAVWSVAIVLIAVIVGMLWKPMWGAWRCVERAASGERVTATVVGAEEDAGLVLALPDASQSCVVSGRPEQFAGLEPGEEVEVFHVLAQPGRCEFVSTVEASEALLWAVGAAAAALLLAIVLVALFAHRSVTQPARLTSRFDLSRLRRVEGVDEETGAALLGVECPQCGKPMREGLVPMLAGMHWREPGEPIGIPHALAGLPGTTSWRGRPGLHAYRCDACEIVLLKYGRANESESGKR